MIKRNEITEAGVFNKPHGIKGEISATLDIDIDLNEVKCIVLDVEGIFVPFFISSVRPKTSETCLIMIDGIDSEEKARTLTGHPFWILDSDLPDDDDDDDDDDGFYAADLIGYRAVDSTRGDLGEIVDINDQTANILFIVRRDDGSEFFIPVAQEFIDGVDPDGPTLLVSLPDELIDLND
ncbi:MAG: 16S rRNA processing protein RimM [Bacteroides sp.]|nr:16S rRNA processing protein RimM [Bacteroides sp.]MBD5333029.1 16S rRNA processing protein RimM [Bacteroides sp.]